MMKEYDYDKINDEVLRRADAVKRKSAARKRVLTAVVTPMCCLILVCAVCIPVLSNSKDGIAPQEADEITPQEIEYADNATKGEVYRGDDSDFSDNMPLQESESGDTQLNDIDYSAVGAPSIGGFRYGGSLSVSVLPTLPELIKEADDIVLVSVVKSARLSGKNGAGEKETWCLYYLKVLCPYKGQLKEGDVFSLSVTDDSIRKPGERMVCFLQENDGGGYSLAFGNYGLMRKKVYHEGFKSDRRLSLKLEELPELIKRTEEK